MPHLRPQNVEMPLPHTHLAARPLMQTFQVRGRLLGSRVTPTISLGLGQFTVPLSRVFLCPHCGEVWARVEVAGSRWGAIIASCDGHGPLPESPFPGGILIPGFPELAGDLPPAVLEYEFQQALRAYNLENEQ